MIQPIALREADARDFLGTTERQWRMLKRKGLIAPHPLTGSYPVADLERLIGNTEERRTLGDVESQPRGDESLGVRQDAGRGKRRHRTQARTLPPPINSTHT